MIHVYDSNETKFDNDGIILRPSTCDLTAQINDVWSLELENPIDDRYESIQDESVISVPTPFGQQRFRIQTKIKQRYGVNVTAYPIFMDAKNNTWVYVKHPTKCNGQQALDILLSGSKYSGVSNIKKISTAYWENKNAIQCISSDDDNSFLNRWGGEICFNNETVIINERLGSDNGMRVQMGFNMKEIKEKVDFSNVITRIVPVAYNGIRLPEGETVDSPLRLNYAKDYYAEIKYEYIKLRSDAQSGDEEEGAILCDTLEDVYDELRKASMKEFESDIDKPSITYDVSIIDLARTEKYKLFRELVTLNLGDTVHIYNERLKIETSARVIKIVYDCIRQEMKELVLGDYVQNFFEHSSDIQRAAETVIDVKNNTIIAEKVKGIIDAAKANLRAQKDVANRSDVRALLFEDLDPDSPTFGAMCAGTQGIEISKKRNETNTDWVWGTAITFESVIADYIITGILSDKTGNFYLNLDTGELVMNDGTFKGNLDTKKTIKIGEYLILANDMENYGNGNEGVIYVGKEKSDAYIIMRESTDFPTAGQVQKRISLVSGKATVSVVDDSVNGINVDIRANGTTLSIRPDGIYINESKGLSGTFKVENSLTTVNGLVTGAS